MTVFQMCSCFSQKSENQLDKVLFTTGQYTYHPVSIKAFNRDRQLKTIYHKECKSQWWRTVYKGTPTSYTNVSTDLPTLVFRGPHSSVVRLWWLWWSYFNSSLDFKNKVFLGFLSWRKNVCKRHFKNTLETFKKLYLLIDFWFKMAV